MKHSLIIISGPGGSGKDTLIAELLKSPQLNLRKLVNVTTRKPRLGEVEGIDYYFISQAEFEKKIDQNTLLEYEIMESNGEYYGTDSRELEKDLAKSHVICKKMPKGSLVFKKRFGKQAITIFLDATVSELERRLQDDPRVNEQDIIRKRLEQAENERALKDQFDHIIANHDGDLAQVVNEATQIIKSVINQIV